MNRPGNKPPRPPRVHLYAIVRVEVDAGPDTPWDHKVTVTKVVANPERAAAEVERLNTLNGGKGAYYFSQITRSEVGPARGAATPPDAQPGERCTAFYDGRSLRTFGPLAVEPGTDVDLIVTPHTPTPEEEAYRAAKMAELFESVPAPDAPIPDAEKEQARP